MLQEPARSFGRHYAGRVSMPTQLRSSARLGPAIAWAPTRDIHHALSETHRTVARVPDLYITQAAILEIDTHLRESRAPLPFGVLAGGLCISPRENLVYLLVDTIARSRADLSGADDPYARLAGELRSLAGQKESRGMLTIGWYVGGMADDLTLDSDGAALHRELFPEPRHVLLLRGEAGGVQHGAFLRFDGSSSTTYPVPFYELLPERANAGEQRTAVQWVEYHTHAHVQPLSERRETRGRVLTPARWHPGRLGASLKTLRQAFRGVAGHQRSARVEAHDGRQAPAPHVRYIVIDGTIVPYTGAQRPSRMYRVYRKRRALLVLLLTAALVLSAILVAYWMAR